MQILDILNSYGMRSVIQKRIISNYHTRNKLAMTKCSMLVDSQDILRYLFNTQTFWQNTISQKILIASPYRLNLTKKFYNHHNIPLSTSILSFTAEGDDPDKILKSLCSITFNICLVFLSDISGIIAYELSRKTISICLDVAGLEDLIILVKFRLGEQK